MTRDDKFASYLVEEYEPMLVNEPDEPDYDLDPDESSEVEVESVESTEPAKKPNSDTSEIVDESDVLEIDGVDYGVDENGNAVDDKGNIDYTAAQIEEMEGEEEGDDKASKTVDLDKVSKITGLEVKKDGKVIKFENTIEGIAKRELAIAEQASKASEENAVNKFFINHPELQLAYKHYNVHGSLTNFNNRSSYKDINFETLTIVEKAKIVKDDKLAKGEDAESVDDYVKYLVDNNKLDTHAKSALNALKAKEVSDVDTINQLYLKKQSDELKAKGVFIKKVKDVITKGEVRGLKIPETFIRKYEGVNVTATKSELVEYMTKPAFVDAEGRKYTTYERDRLEESLGLNEEDDVIKALTLFIGNSDLIKSITEAKIKKNIIKKRVKKEEGSTSSGRRFTGRVKDEDIED